MITQRPYPCPATRRGWGKIDDILHPDGKPGKKDEQFNRRWLKISNLLDGMGAIDGSSTRS